MMYEKAVLFKDQTTAEKILQTDDVAEIKVLGRTVQNFDEKVWVKEREGIVYRGVSENSVRILNLLKNWSGQVKR